MLKQTIAITAMSLKSIPQRPLSALVTIIGVATMVAVMTALLAVGAGLTASGTKNIGPDIALVITKGAADYMGSLPREAVGIVAQAPGVKRDPGGRPYVAPSASIGVGVIRKDDHSTANA